ncbi:MAG: fluoride efflux transporter CrcB [Flavobacteriaceae bacterium]
MKQILLVFIGGGIGSATRFGIGRLLKNTIGTFPIGTFFVNIVGCLLIGVLMGWGLKNQNINENQTLLLITGFCGGFTTFSAFAAENQFFLKNGEFTQFLTYTLASLILGILAVIFGLFISKHL